MITRPMVRSLTYPLARALTAAGLGVAFDPATMSTYYVDSVNGLDANSGLTSALPKQTLAGVPTLTAGQSVALARGSTWREQFNIAANNVRVGVYGTGAMPILDGADVATTWTQPDAGTYPNVWSRSWTRTSATTTGEEKLGLWIDGVRPRYATNATTDLNASAGWFTTSLTTQTSTVSIYSADDPNSNGKVYEITKRHYGINGHTVTNAARTGVTITGKVEIKRCVGHYNALTGPSGSAVSGLLLRDGNIHHLTTEGATTTDCIATEYSPNTTAPSPFVAYRTVGTGFSHTFRRCLSLFPGGTGRLASGAFYMHASTPSTTQSLTLEGCASRGSTFVTADSALITVTGGYAEDTIATALGNTSANATYESMLILDLTAAADVNGTRAIRRLSTAYTFTASNVAAYTLKGIVFQNTAGGTKPIITNCALLSGVSGNNFEGGEAAMTYTICIGGGRQLQTATSSYTGDYNVFQQTGQAGCLFNWNGNNYLTVGTALGLFQAASGQDTNSVFLKATDQTTSNANAFWLGVKEGGTGPAAGDFRINPAAKVYSGAGTAFTGTFADGVTAITLAGPQQHWDFNLRALVAGPPERYPVLPATVAECRTYLESPTTWDFYP